MKESNIKVIYEDKSVLVINKPSGLIVHSDGRTKEPTLCDWILEKYPAIKNVGEPLVLQSGKTINKYGIVHRLDKDTSGAIVIAKTQSSFDSLKKQFKQREVEKKYNAFVYGEMKNKKGVVNRPIGRSNKDFRMKSAQRGAKGKLREAVTEYRVLKTNKNFSYLEVYPKTGRTHQIRVHLKAINHPVMCDKLYAPKRECDLGLGRLALHARSIKFKNLNNKEIEVEAELPDNFQNALKKLA